MATQENHGLMYVPSAPFPPRRSRNGAEEPAEDGGALAPAKHNAGPAPDCNGTGFVGTGTEFNPLMSKIGRRSA